MATGAHVRIDILLPKFPRRLRSVLNYVAYFAMTAFAAMLAHYSWKLCIESFETDARAMSFLRTPIGWPQGIMAFGFTMLAVQAGLMLASTLLDSMRSGKLEDVRVLQMSDLSEGL
jgi:TRAP-type C4-dicarboxylate transport system permease small subunit